MLMHAIAHRDCTDTALEVDWKKKSLAAPGTRTGVSITPGFAVGCEHWKLTGRKNPLPHRGLEPASVLRLALQLVARIIHPVFFLPGEKKKKKKLICFPIVITIPPPLFLFVCLFVFAWKSFF